MLQVHNENVELRQVVQESRTELQGLAQQMQERVIYLRQQQQQQTLAPPQGAAGLHGPLPGDDPPGAGLANGHSGVGMANGNH